MTNEVRKRRESIPTYTNPHRSVPPSPGDPGAEPGRKKNKKVTWNDFCDLFMEPHQHLNVVDLSKIDEKDAFMVGGDSNKYFFMRFYGRWGFEQVLFYAFMVGGDSNKYFFMLSGAF